MIDVSGRSVRHVGVGYSPEAAAVSGSEAYVVNSISGMVTPLAVPSGRRG